MKANPLVLGIDPSLNACGWSLFSGSMPQRCGTIKAKVGGDKNAKLQAIADFIVDLCVHNELDAIAIESEHVFRSTTAVLVGEVIGVIKGAIMATSIRKIPIYDANPKSVRALLQLNSADKDALLNTARMLFPKLEIPDHNAADAVFIGNFAYHSYRGTI